MHFKINSKEIKLKARSDRNGPVIKKAGNKINKKDGIQ